ncbi:TetR/AcrR family transcriptional regulator [uncultured Acetobacterium sp.]|uniref:TetR/AcrR family transcriptional regulator n=1 Tax=uncultured Acetobacterium sp. TaxID=217139 RepID=UPI0025D61069|nr:TetR/AcrR family transcriptional regulator [uncultured Acetobacterium sp.]
MRREKILRIAYEKFSIKGYNTPLSEIAVAAGIKKQSIYNYFENKDALFFEMIKLEVDVYFHERLDEIRILKDGDPEEQLKTIFFSIIDYYSDISKLKFWRWLLLIDSKDLFERTQASIHYYESEISKELQSCVANLLQDEKKVEEYAIPIIQSFMTVLHGTLDGILLYQDVFDTEIYTENVWFMFWTGVKCIINQDSKE